MSGVPRSESAVSSGPAGPKGGLATSVQQTADTTRQAVEVCRELVDPALRAAVDGMPNSMRRIVGYHLGWWDEHGARTSTASGKAIRPTLVLMSASAVGAKPREAVPAGVAVELVHNFSLLHDDVMDGDLTRRHRPTAWSLFGIGAAILAGDALLTLALDVLAASGHRHAGRGMRMLSAAVQDLVDGQSADIAFEHRDVVAPSECEGMSAAKTAALIGCCCALGGLLGNGTETQVQHLRDFGEHLGLAYQHTDDLLGIWGDPAVTGKPVYSDLRNRKKSLPVVAALNSDTAAGRELATLYRRAAPLSDGDLARAAELVERAGGRRWSHDRSQLELTSAIRQLELVDGHRAAAELAGLARLVAGRDH